ncbi:unnamed protein product [Rhizoctonia solani]|uniref:WD repeat-containing protein JIP5 n=1 Tax=Rhizoctonia solani TaxID=456999 RepID=A0A8H3DKC3_9AGAM|nr:unnamed protein product [Rhizoctonia solani]
MASLARTERASLKVFGIPELAHLICATIQKRDNVSLMRVCRQLFYYILPFVWEEVDEANSLMSLIPGGGIVINDPELSPYMVMQLPNSLELSRFNVYGPHVKRLTPSALWVDEYDDWEGFLSCTQSVDLLPNLETLYLPPFDNTGHTTNNKITEVFDLAFNPKHDIVYAGLLSGHVKAFSYDDEGTCIPKFDTRPTKKTARSLTTDSDGLELYSVSKDRSIQSAINRVTRFMSMLATGDDNGVIKLWDPRQISPIRSYTHHFDFISDFLWLQDKKHLITTSGDGTLSVIDVRSGKTEPFAHSEDQDDELLSIASIKDGKKVAVGTQTGIISLWNRSSGWGDCVDRMKGHPHSVDALATLSEDVIVTGSSDGLVRVVQVLPNKLLGVIADHGTFPIERLRTDRNGAWLGSVSHDNVLKLTDVRDALVDSDEEDSNDESHDASEEGAELEGNIDDDSDSDSEQSGNESAVEQGQNQDGADSDSESDVSEAPAAQPGSDSEPEPQPELASSRKRKKKSQQEGSGNKKGKMDTGFFDEL